MKRTIFTIFAIFCIFSQVLAAEGQKQYIFNAVNPDYGFSFNEVSSVEIDDNGMLWFGCENGLFYYNTDQFKQYAYSTDDDTTPQSNLIYDIFKDSKGQLWICTSRGLSRFDSATDSFVRITPDGIGTLSPRVMVERKDGTYLLTDGKTLYTFVSDDVSHFKPIDTGYDAEITALYIADDDRVYIGYSDGSVARASGALSSFKMITQRNQTDVVAICLSEGLLYVGYQESGLDVFDEDGRLIRRYDNESLTSSFVRDVKARHNGDVWVGTQRGVFIIYTDGTIQRVEATENNNLSNGSVFEIAVDSNDNVFLGLWGGYVVFYSDHNKQFIRASQSLVASRSFTSYFVQRDKNSIWVGRERGGLSSYNYKTDSFSESRYEDMLIKSFVRDSKDDLWIGTFRQGLFHYDVKSDVMRKVDLPEDFEKNAIMSSVVIDSLRSVVWIGSRYTGVMSYDLNTRRTKVYHIEKRDDKTDRSRVWDMQVRESGDLVVFSDNGLSILELGADDFVNYKYRYDADLNSIYTHCTLDDDRILVGTRYRGIMIFDLNERRFLRSIWRDELSHLNIFKLIKDRRGRIWASTNSGVYMCDREDSNVVSYGIDEGLISANMYPNSGVLVDDGTIFFGSNRGFNFLNTNNIDVDDVAPRTNVLSILVNHQPISEDNCLEIDSRHIENAHYIKLTHNNNSLSFNVASNGVSGVDNNSLRFRLIGYQDEWVEMLESKDIVYTKLPFGRYSLEVESSDNSGEWGEPAVLNIEILAPIYLRWYAWVLYLAIFAAIVVGVVREIAFRVRAKRDVAIERHKNALDTKAYNQRTKFFVNVSHELRTPLSLIVTPLNILESENKDGSLNVYIDAIKRNTNRLLRLTNQILDLRLMEVGKISAVTERVDIVELCQQTYGLFEYRIGENQIKFRFASSSRAIYANVDFDMIDKVVCNLLSNAFKFTGEGGSLTLEVVSCECAEANESYDFFVGERVDGKCVEIVVSDSGAGIEKDRMEHIFDRFVYNRDTSISGSGIGLHMCKEYIALHSGAIRVRSTVGEGSVFSVVIPVSDVAVEGEAPVVVEPYVDQDITLPNFNIDAVESTEGGDEDGSKRVKPKVLIADDNAEIRLFLKKVLSSQFNCLTANNGEQSLDVAKNAKPDLILMDILMPVMNGIECVKELRKDPETHFVPIILLTGVTDEATVVECMESGADCHLSKPININLLSAHINRLLSKQSKFTSIIKTVPEAPIAATNGDDLQQLIETIIDKNINNASLDTEYIAKQLNMSRSTLHRRVKSELNIGVNEVIRDYRLRVAVKLMDSANYNVDELAICVGFNSTSYFCKAFKVKYGTSPKRYKDQLKWSSK